MAFGVIYVHVPRGYDYSSVYLAGYVRPVIVGLALEADMRRGGGLGLYGALRP